MWILNWLPDFVFHLILAAGIAGLLASWVLKRIQFVAQWGLAIQIVSIILTVAGVWYEGGIAKDQEYRAQIAEMKVAIAKADAASADANAKLVDTLAKQKKAIQDITWVNQKRLAELASTLNKNCVIDDDIIDLLNASAKNQKAAK